MHRRGRPRIRRVAAKHSVPKGERIDEFVNVLRTRLLLSQRNLQYQRRAHKLGAKSYDGTGDPECTLSWLKTNKEIFQVMGCTKEQMVTYSALLLKDRAKDWWKALQRIQPEGVSWANFRREFLEKFYPKSYRDARVKKFFRLEKGSLAIAEYEKTFLDLIRAVLFIADNEEQKANRYAVGLNPKIRAYVSLAAHTQFGPLVEAATSVERSMAANPRPKQ
ncbi:hypothetical protein JRO89_XS01G0085600 [Xanthoceras sorbifolium]|uniref:Retrotransposon gag domain-containing protein n=1 Tax=Xanthoceras sorbifolium TaxID=99658 RepID=A0ABQ8IIK1_9ROSI|nr:hypothetical protein JRO89_XS01G0085600 [Xanthoceras sorbifolium]